MVRKKCCDPFNVSHRKPEKQIGLQRLVDSQRRDGRLVVPEFDWDSEEERFLCLNCRTRLCHEFEELFEYRRNAEAFQEARVLQEDEQRPPVRRPSVDALQNFPRQRGAIAEMDHLLEVQRRL